MAKAVTRKRSKRKTKKKAASWLSRVNIKGIIYTFILLSLLIFSLSVLTYVIFFRMVVAAELETVTETQTEVIKYQFEEANPSIQLVQDNEAAQPRVAIIIDDMGYHRDLGESLIGLPHNVSFSFLPHAPFTARLEKMAFDHGKTVLLHQPLEPKDESWDPGPGALYLNELDQQRQIFNHNLSLVPHATGVNNHMGSLYTENETGMRALLELIGERGLFFIDSFTTSSSQGYALAQKAGIQSARRHIFLDNIQESEAICKQLEDLANTASKNGRAIGIAHPHPKTFLAIQTCLQSVEKVAQLVSVDKLVK